MADAQFEDPDELIVCPYDPVHLVARKRMPYHIMKCRKNFGQKNYLICPFNARHVVHRKEYDAHISRCEDRGRIEAELLREQEEKQNEGKSFKGNTSVPSSNFVTDSTESWDDSDYVVEIKKQPGGLFSETESRGGGGGREISRSQPQQAQQAKVSNPLPVRMPRSMPGAGSEVYEYSVRQQKEERQLPQSKPQPRAVPLGRGRGRGRGRGFGAAGQPSLPTVGRPTAQSQAAAQPLRPKTSQEELMKSERKLRKMLRQIENLELRKENGEKLNDDQEDKIMRKDEVIVELEQVQKLCQMNM